MVLLLGAVVAMLVGMVIAVEMEKGMAVMVDVQWWE